MQLAFIVAVLAAVVIADSAPSQPVEGAALRIAFAVVGMLLVAGFAAVSSGVFAYRFRCPCNRRRLLLRFRRVRMVHTVLWLVVAVAILHGLKWGQVVRFNLLLDRSVLLDDLLILAPVFVPMLLSWAAFYEVERTVRAALDDGAAAEFKVPSRWQYLLLHVRHYLGILLLPVLLLLGFQDVAELLRPGVMASRYAVAVYALPFAFLLVGFPVLLRRVWTTRPLELGPLRDRLEAAARRTGFRARETLLWHTGGLVANAAVAGFLARLRYVFLTDGLVDHLDEEEIEAVFLHEVGHVFHRHLLRRVLAMVAPLCAWLVFVQWVPAGPDWLDAWWTAPGLDPRIPPGLVMLGGMACYVLFVFGLYSRRLEAQADLFACRALAAGEVEHPVEIFVSALEKLAALNGTNRKTPGWQHASIARRVDFLHRAGADDAYRRRFHRSVLVCDALLAAVVLAPVWHFLFFG